MGMSEVGRMQVWVRTVGGERGCGCAGGQVAGEDAGMGMQVGRILGKMLLWERRWVG